MAQAKHPLSEEEKVIRREFRKLKTKIKNQIKDLGIRTAELSLEHVKNTPSITLPSSFLNRDQTVTAYQDAIYDYLHGGV